MVDGLWIVFTSAVKLYMDTLVAWVRRYIKHSPHSSRPDVKRHGPFYSACQAVFYVFVYRHEDILHTYGEQLSVAVTAVTCRYLVQSCLLCLPSDSSCLVRIILFYLGLIHPIIE